MSDLDKMLAQAAYQRAKALDEIFNDADFRGDHPHLDDAALRQILTKQLADLGIGDLGIGFPHLQLMLELFPGEEEWNDLTTLMQKARKVNSSEELKRQHMAALNHRKTLQSIRDEEAAKKKGGKS